MGKGDLILGRKSNVSPNQQSEMSEIACGLWPECTWEPFDSSKATLSAALEGKRIRMYLRGSWSTGLVTEHVEGSMFKVRFSSRDHAVHDLELPPISNYTEWHLEGMSEWENN